MRNHGLPPVVFSMEERDRNNLKVSKIYRHLRDDTNASLQVTQARGHISWLAVDVMVSP